MSRLFQLFLACLVLTTSSVGCSISQNQDPAAAAERWFASVATMKGLEADELTCLGQRDNLRQQMTMGSAFMILGELFLGGVVDAEVDTSKVQFNTISQTNDKALVAVNGEVRTEIGGSVNSELVDMNLQMVKEDGEWKWCGDMSSISDEIRPSPTARMAEELETPELLAQAPLDSQGLEIPQNAQEHFAAYEAFQRLLATEEIKTENIREVEYKTLSSDNESASVAVIFDLWDEVYQIWLEDSQIVFDARYLAGKWNIDALNYSYENSPAAISTIEVIEQGTRIASEQFATVEAEAMLENFGGTIVFQNRNIMYPSFTVIDQLGNESTLEPEALEGVWFYALGSLALSPVKDKLFYAYKVNNQTIIASVDLAGENAERLYVFDNVGYDKNDIGGMSISPDGSKLALNVNIGERVDMLSLETGEINTIFVSPDRNSPSAGPLAWSPDSTDMYAIFNDIRNTRESKAYLAKLDLDGGGDPEKIKDLEFAEQYFFPNSSLIITPDGGDIIFGLEDSRSRSGIVLMSLNGDDVFYLLDGSRLCFLHLASDGSRLIFTDQTDVYSLNMNTGEKFHSATIPLDGSSGDSCYGGSIAWSDNNTLNRKP